MNEAGAKLTRQGEVSGHLGRALLLILLLCSASHQRQAGAQTDGAPAPAPHGGQQPEHAPLSAADAAEPQPTPPPYRVAREEEDWGFLRERSRRTDFFDPVKYIRLREGRDDWYLSLGGEVRPYYERFRNEGWGAAPQDSDGFWLQRYMLHADVRMGGRFRAFFQLKSGVETDRRGGPRPPDEDYLDVHQAFFDLNFDLGGGARGGGGGAPPGGSAGGKGALTLRVGRQQLHYGSGRLVSLREGPNVPHSFDAVRLIFRADGWRVDGFAARPAETKRGFFDDGADSSQSLWGVYAVRPVGFAPDLKMDVYYMGLDRKLARFDQGAGREVRHSFGARFSNSAPGGANARGAFDYDVEIVGQSGTFRPAGKGGPPSGAIRAYTVGTHTGYTLRGARFSPRFGFGASVISGDRDPSDPDLGSFNPLFPRGSFFGQIAQNGAVNVRVLQPSLTLRLAENLSAGASTYYYWRDSVRDGLYGPPSNLMRAGRLSAARYIGTQHDLELTWDVSRHAAVKCFYAYYSAGRYLRETPPGGDLNFFGTFISYRF